MRSLSFNIEVKEENLKRLHKSEFIKMVHHFILFLKIEKDESCVYVMCECFYKHIEPLKNQWRIYICRCGDEE
jgi:hypothetical protein